MKTVNRQPWALFALLICTLALLWSTALRAGPDIQHWETPNGARVYFVQAPELPMVDIRVVFAAGASRDGDQPGVGLLTNALLAEGAGRLSADQISRRFDAVGARFSNDSLRDMSLFSLRSLTEPARLDPAVETFALVLGAPTFPERAFQRERGRVLVALQQQKQDPGEILERRFYRALYGDHPYAIPPLGTEVSVKALTVADLRAHYEKFYVARNAVVAIVGDVDRAGAERLAEQVTVGLEPGQAAPPLPAPAALQSAGRITVEYPSTQTHVWIGQLGIARGDRDYFPLYVGNHILGGSGLVSRISQEVREKRGLAYSASSGLSAMEQRGPFLLGLQTANANRQEATDVLRETLERFVAKGPSEQEVERAVKNITGGFPLQIDSNSDIVSLLGMIGFYSLPLDYIDTFPEKVAAVSATDVRRAFQALVHPDRLLTVTVGGR